MTIVLDVRLIDKMILWFNKNYDGFKRFFLMIILIGSTPAFVFGVLAWFDIINVPMGSRFLVYMFTIGSFLGTVIFWYIATVSFLEFNRQHKWFSLKRLEKQND